MIIISQAVILTDINGTELSKISSDLTVERLYYIDLSAGGSQTCYFYIDINGNISYRQTNIYIATNAAVTAEGTLEMYAEGDPTVDASWKGMPPYDFNLTAVESQLFNGLYPTMEFHYSHPKRLYITVSGDCRIYCKITSE